MKKEKIGLTPMNWILSILGILLLSCFIVLPPVFRSVFKEKEKEEFKTEITIEKLICEKKEIVSEQYMENHILTFYYYNDNIRTYSKNTNRTYNDQILYENDKQKFGRYVTAFSLLSGYVYSIDPNDEEFVININEEYDLGIFKPTIITLPGDSEEVTVTSIYSKSDSINQIKTDLISNGYTCR